MTGSKIESRLIYVLDWGFLSMDVRSWMNRSRERISNQGISGFYQSLDEVKKYITRNMLSLTYPSGEQIYSKEWDVLIILDACRFDLMKEVSVEYDFVRNIQEHTSVGSTSTEWMKKNFVSDYESEMKSTIYICGNPFSDDILSHDQFQILSEVWRYDWDEDAGTIKPRSVTDRAIKYHREEQPKRMIVHYMQPHYPFFSVNICNGITLSDFGEEGGATTPWDLLRAGEVSRREVWRGYKQNLSIVLDELELLFENMEAQNVIVTSDHGNALGEQGIYGHPYGWPLDSLRKVPWIETTARDEESHNPVIEDSNSEKSVEERLKSLGYK